jgi:two-component system LytT family sensor kinase
MVLFKKFSILVFLPFIVISLIEILSRSSFSEFQAVFLGIFSIGFFSIVSLNSVYVADYFLKKKFSFFKKSSLLILTTFISVFLFSYLLNNMLRSSDYRITTIFSQATLGVCIFLLEYLVMSVLDKKETKLVEFHDRKQVYVFLLSLIIFVEFALFFLISSRDASNLYPFLMNNKLILIYMFISSIVSFFTIRLLTYMKCNTILNVFLSSLGSMFFSLLFTVVLTQTKFTLNKHFGIYLIIYLISLFSTLFIYVFLLYKMQIREKNVLNFKLTQKNAQYLELKNQINPHFLFNNLNTLISFIEDNPQKAIEFGHNLSNVYRHYLSNHTDDFVNLKTELNFIKEYLEIYKAKFENGFTFIITNEVDSNAFILSVSIQEIIDNIFKHNCLDEDNPLSIKIQIEHNFLVISNSILPKKADFSNNTGLDNINKRYELLVNRSIVINTIGDEFIVKLPILEIES